MYLCGNGGSAANAIHIANDWIACGIRAYPLTADIATLTAIANDYGYTHVFGRQLDVLGEPGDLLVVLSGSGNSPNILQAISTAHTKGMQTWAIAGGGKALELADHVLRTPTNMQKSEEDQLRIGHDVMCRLKHLHG